jgi:carboxyl-terminal processing protease
MRLPFVVPLLAITFSFVNLAALADEARAVSTAQPADDPQALAQWMTAVADLILARHIDPPARQEMIRTGLKAAFVAAEHDPPSDLSARVSTLANHDDLAEYVRQIWPQIGDLQSRMEDRSKAADVPTNLSLLRSSVLRGMLKPVVGEPDVLSATEAKVQAQLAANRYVGLGIALGVDDEQSYPQIREAFPAGAAAKAGALKDDLILEIDGIGTKGTPLQEIVGRLRGEEGSAITIVVRRPDESSRRRLNKVRAVVPRQTVQGYRNTGPDQWDCRVEADAPIAYLRISEIGASVLDELRQYERRLLAEGMRALILDFRGQSDRDLHYAVTLADGLLDGGVIGHVKTRWDSKTYQADADCLFRDWPLAVLVDERTHGTYAWVAAALQKQRGAVVVGDRPFDREPFITNVVELPGAEGLLRLATTQLQCAGDSELAVRNGYLDLEPDFKLNRSLTAEEVAEAEDPVVSTAIEVLRSKLPPGGD